MPTGKRIKNPKRVAAGEKSAEARRLKQRDVDERLAQLQELKKNMQPVDHSSAGGTPASPRDGVTVEPPQPSRHPVDWAPWIAGGLGLAAVAWYITKSGVTKYSPVLTSTRASPAPAVQAPVARDVNQHPHLNRQDPFFME